MYTTLKVFAAVVCFVAVTVSSNQNTNIEPTTCTFTNSTSVLQCNSSAGSEKCDTQPLGLTQDLKEFAINSQMVNGGENPQVWFRLHPLKADKSGWWYFKGFEKATSQFSIHSKAKHSLNDVGFIVLDDVCWIRIAEIIRSSQSNDQIVTQVRNMDPLSHLFRRNKHNAQVIGKLTIVD